MKFTNAHDITYRGKQFCPRGRNALTEGDPGMMPRDRKADASGVQRRLGLWQGCVNHLSQVLIASAARRAPPPLE